jgi:hypothetical protein
MSEALIRWLADRQFIAFVMLLVALLLMRSLNFIDSSQFMVGYLALGAGYFGADLFKKAPA